MIYTNLKIISEIENGSIYIGIDESHSIESSELFFDTTSLNLQLGHELFKWNDKKNVVLDPSATNYSFSKFAKENGGYIEIEDEGYILKPHQFVLGTTLEYIKLNQSVGARIEGKSSLGRIGLGVHVTAPTIHAEFEGRITLEIKNHSNFDIKLRRDMSICQLIFEETSGEVAGMSERTFHKQMKACG